VVLAEKYRAILNLDFSTPDMSYAGLFQADALLCQAFRRSNGETKNPYPPMNPIVLPPSQNKMHTVFGQSQTI
jgi:hypothetical protein